MILNWHCQSASHLRLAIRFKFENFHVSKNSAGQSATNRRQRILLIGIYVLSMRWLFFPRGEDSSLKGCERQVRAYLSSIGQSTITPYLSVYEVFRDQIESLRVLILIEMYFVILFGQFVVPGPRADKPIAWRVLLYGLQGILRHGFSTWV